jgi:aspartate/methionine/tyrosine aminotransferase
LKVSKKVAGVEYAIRDIVSAATKLEKQGKKIQYLNIGDPVLYGFQPPDNVKEALIKAIQKGENYYAPSEGLPE